VYQGNPKGELDTPDLDMNTRKYGKIMYNPEMSKLDPKKVCIKKALFITFTFTKVVKISYQESNSIRAHKFSLVRLISASYLSINFKDLASNFIVGKIMFYYIQ
jgi:hypothetical protein